MKSFDEDSPASLSDNARKAREALAYNLGEMALVDPVSRGFYSSDASVYQFTPVAIVVPKTERDIARVLQTCRRHNVPVTLRGGGTSLAGQTCNEAVILDVSKHLNRVLEVNEEERWARVQPGLVRDELNAHLKPTGLEFAPETSTSNRAAIGGMIGNNSSGVRSIRYGRTMEHVLEARVMLASGEVIDCVPRTQTEIDKLIREDGPEGRIWAEMKPLVEKNRALIEERFPKVLRRVGGYSLDVFPKDEKWNLATFLCGSEGTLGVLLEAKVNLVPAPKNVRMMAIHYEDLIDGLRTVPEILKHEPLSVELLDGAMIELSRNNPATQRHCFFIEGKPGVILSVEMEGETEAESIAKLEKLRDDLKAGGHGYHFPLMDTPEKCFEVMELRRKGLGVSLSVPGDTKPVSWVEDACVPVEHLADYTAGVLDLASGFGLNTVIYGHASVGVLHIKPALNLKDPKHLEAMAAISKGAMELCRGYGGSWSGEHGDGVARGAQNLEFWGQEMYDVFREVKRIWDPQNILNPNRIIGSPPVNENLRYGTDYKVQMPETHFRFREFGGFAPAVEMCNGVGACRKTMAGTMCPSYMATRDEEDTTRARANALRLAMTGQFGKDGMTSERLYEVLDLCLECKACKSECPSNVDMARMKSEFLAHYQAEHGRTLRSRLFAETPVIARLSSGPLAVFANAPMKFSFLRKPMLKALGIAPKRIPPAYTGQKLETWFRKRKKAEKKTQGKVALYADCWANYNETSTGRWAVKLLEALGYEVELISNACCQRTRISKGYLEEAKRDGAVTVRKLLPYAEKNIPVLGLEPSCLSGITDDLPDLVPNMDDAKKVAKVAKPIEEFLREEVKAGRLKLPAFKGQAPRYLVHGHCHQKAIYSTSPIKELLLMGGSTEVTEVDSGCCGMAGSFGYEAEHYDVSQKIGERRLLPAVRAAAPDTVIVANGFSCRHQVHDFADRKPMHSIEVLARAITGKWPAEK